MSDQTAAPSWQPDALLHRATEQPSFLRHAWDESKSQDFGPWRHAPKSNPFDGQTQSFSAEENLAVTTLEPDPELQPLLENATAEITATELTHDQESAVQSRIDQALEQGRIEGRELAFQEMAAGLEKNKQSLAAIAIALQQLQSDPQRLLEPLKKLAIHIAEELVRGELRLDTQVIERLIKGCIDALEQPAQTTIVQLGHLDLQRMRDVQLPGVVFELDESLSEGSVKAKVLDTQVQDLIEHRLAQLSQQILGAGN